MQTSTLRSQNAPVSSLAIASPTCDMGTNPLGIDQRRPGLSWKLRSDARGAAQSAYQVLVARSRATLDADKGDLWDSGKIASDRTSGISYAGLPLESSARVFWKVRAWDNDGIASKWSDTSEWTIGLLDPSDWKGKWIGGTASDRLPIFRREFEVRPGLERAIVHVCGLGQYELSINGKKMGDAVLSPGWTKYDKTCLYDTLDLTPALRPGANTVGVMLGNGMYNVTAGRYSKFVGSFGKPQVIAQVELFYADGTHETIATDPSWRTTPGPITFSSIYGGEDHDARLTPAGWDSPGFDATSWTEPAVTTGPGGELRGYSHAAPPLKTFDVFPVKASSKRSETVTVYDFGQNVSMIPRIVVTGKAGSVVRITPAELIKADGSIDRASVGGKAAYWQYTLSGTGRESWFPQFFYHGARYVSVEVFPPDGSTDLPKVESIESVVVQSASTAVGAFSCSNDLFNKTHDLIRWAQRSNLVSVLTDCPHRERLGWLEQYHLHGPSLRYEFDLNQLFAKTVQDMADSQTAAGLVPDIAPEYTRFSGGFLDSPEWGSAAVLVPWQQYEWTGDTALLARHYDTMKRYVDYLTTKSKDHIVSHGLGDWYDIGPKKPGKAQLTPIPLTATAFYYEDARILGEAAKLLGKDDDAKKYAALAADIRTAFNAKFFDVEKHYYATGSQTGQAIPLAMNMVDPANCEAVVTALVADCKKSGLTAGDIGHRYLLRALADAGRSDVIFDLHSRSDKPGYGFILAKGATALTETWDARPDSSHNHFMLGHIMEWFYHDLAGIQSDPTGPGFRRIIIRPTVVGDVTWAKASYDSVRGEIASSWKRENGLFTLDVVIPTGATATVYFPTDDVPAVMEGGKSANVKVMQGDKGLATFAVPSGRYSFTGPLK